VKILVHFFSFPQLQTDAELSIMVSSHPKPSSPQSNCENISNSTVEVIDVKIAATRFIKFRLTSTGRTMRRNNPFHILEDLNSIAGKVTNASRLKNVSLLVEVSNEKQADVLLQAKILG
jgi:hypothetical protein